MELSEEIFELLQQAYETTRINNSEVTMGQIAEMYIRMGLKVAEGDLPLL